jgi:peptidyl-prolyl cis-trans isomerase D
MALGFMRRHRRWLYGFLWLVIFTFIILYIPAFTAQDEQGLGAPVAEVGDRKITVGEYQRSYMRTRQMYQNMYQGRMTDDLLRRLGIEEQALQGLVDEQVLALEAERLGLKVDDEVVKHRLATSPEFQQDGRFLGAQEIRRRLERQGVSVREFEESLRRNVLRERLISLVTDGVKVTAAEAEQEFRRRNEQIKVEYVQVTADQSGLSATDDEVKARFDADKERYKLPERCVLSYLLVDAAAMGSRVTLTERDKQAYYEAHRDEMQTPEELCASHILVKVKATPDAAEGHAEDEARRLAQAALDEVKGGADFAAVAKRVSEDLGSGPQGGDLGCFPRGRMVPEFDSAAFALDAGQISEVVRTSFGYHVIKAISRKDESVPPYAAVRDQIQQAATAERAQALAREKADAVAAALRAGRSLEEAGREQGLTAQKSGPLARADVRPPLSSPTLMAKAFEMKKGETAPDAFPLGTGYAFVAVDDVQPPRIPDLKEIAEKVRADVVVEKGYARARGAADALRVRAEREGLEKAASASSLVRKQTDGLVARSQPLGDLGTSPSLEAAWTLPVGALSEPLKTTAGWGVLRVLEKKEFDRAAFEKEKAALMASLAEQRKGQLFQAYMQQARKRFPVQRRPDVLQRVAS